MEFLVFDGAQLSAFLAAAMVLTLAPGPDNLMVLSLAMARGRRHGVAFGLGCAAGCLSHTAVAALGLGALIAASPVAFTALRLAGGLYLAWLGIQVLRQPALAATAPMQGSSDSRALFLRGLLANAINPKVVLFFLAFLPQFVDAGRGSVAVQTLGLGLVFALQAAVLFSLLGAFAGGIGERLWRRPALGRWLNRLAGITFVGLGARLVMAR